MPAICQYEAKWPHNYINARNKGSVIFNLYISQCPHQVLHIPNVQPCSQNMNVLSTPTLSRCWWQSSSAALAYCIIMPQLQNWWCFNGKSSILTRKISLLTCTNCRPTNQYGHKIHPSQFEDYHRNHMFWYPCCLALPVTDTSRHPYLGALQGYVRGNM